MSDLFEHYRSTTYSARNDMSPEGLAKAGAAEGREFGPYLPEDRTGPILDVGCGAGGFLRHCRQQGYSDVEGIDISRDQVDFCHESGFPEVICTDALSYLSEGDKRYHLILMSDILEHLPKTDVLPTLEAAGRRLAPSGRLVVRVPNLSNPLNLRTRYVDFTHEVGFSRESLAQVFRMSGLEPLQVYGTHGPHRRWLARLVFDRLLWWAFLQFYRHTLQLKDQPSRGKNIIGVARRSGPAAG